MFVLFVDVLVVVSDVLAVGDALTLGCYAVFNEPVRQLLQGLDGTAHARRKASCSKSRQQCPGCLTCGSYLIKLSLRLGLYFADLPFSYTLKLKLHMLDLLKTATAVFYQLICRNASLQMGWFYFLPLFVLPRSPQVVFVAEIGHGRKGPVFGIRAFVIQMGWFVGIRVRCHCARLISYHACRNEDAALACRARTWFSRARIRLKEDKIVR